MIDFFTTVEAKYLIAAMGLIVFFILLYSKKDDEGVEHLGNNVRGMKKLKELRERNKDKN